MNTAAAKDADVTAELSGAVPEPDKKKRRKKKNQGEEAEHTPRKKRRMLKFLLIFLPICLIVGFLYATIRYDFRGVRTWVLALVNRLDPAYVTVEQEARDLQTQREQLMLDQAKLVRDRENLDAREALLDVREERITNMEIERTPIHRRMLSDAKRQELESLGKIYNNMESVEAAEIVTELYDVIDMATLFYFMNQAKAAEVMSFLDPALAAAVTEELMWERGAETGSGT